MEQVLCIAYCRALIRYWWRVSSNYSNAITCAVMEQWRSDLPTHHVFEVLIFRVEICLELLEIWWEDRKNEILLQLWICLTATRVTSLLSIQKYTFMVCGYMACRSLISMVSESGCWFLFCKPEGFARRCCQNGSKHPALDDLFGGGPYLVNITFTLLQFGTLNQPIRIFLIGLRVGRVLNTEAL